MPKTLTQYRVFIASPGGLEEERKRFRYKLERYTAVHSEPRGVSFQPVGWEKTTGGAGRPQELINKDLSECDYAVFILHDRWGSPTGSIYTSGVEEEWEISEKLYAANKIRNIALFFKQVDPHQMRDPGAQLAAVLTFKKRIEKERRYLFRQYDSIEQFTEMLEEHLASWLRGHENATTAPLAGNLVITGDATSARPAVSPGFDYWIEEGNRLLETDVSDHNAVLFCAMKATNVAASDIEWARAINLVGVAHFHLGKPDESIMVFTSITERFATSIDADRREWQARALFNKGVTLGALSRSAEEIAVYDDLLARFGTATELPLREQVARTLAKKGFRLGALNRSAEEIAVYDNLLTCFGTATELPLRAQVANALFNKGFRFGTLNRSVEAIAAYDDLLVRFGTATELPLRTLVAKTLVNKGFRLGILDRKVEAIAAYDNMLARFGTATELPLREQVALAESGRKDLRNS